MKKTFSFIFLASTLLLVCISCQKNVTGITLNKTSLTIAVGETETLIATVMPEKAVNKSVTFTSSNILVATVMPNGLVTAITKGTTTIVATTVEGGFSASCTVTVDEIAVTGVTLNKEKLILDIDETEILIATVLPENATNNLVWWSISNPMVATVINGLVTPLSLGKATITVTTVEGNKTAKCELEVIKRVAVTTVTLNKDKINIGVGITERLKATISPNNASNKNVIWSSSNSSVASVDDKGLVSANAEGAAIITVITEEGGFEATCEVNCSDFSPPVVITLGPTDKHMEWDGDTPTYYATLRGEITFIGDPRYTERGFRITTEEIDPYYGAPDPYEVKVSGTGIGIFSYIFSTHGYSLDYYRWKICAYAKTSWGTIYGNEVTLN